MKRTTRGAVALVVLCLFIFPLFAGSVQATSTTWTVTFKYHDERVTPHNDTYCVGAKVTVFKQGRYGLDPVVSGYTNSQGAVAFSVTTPLQYIARIYCDDEHTNKVSHVGFLLSEPLSWDTDWTNPVTNPTTTKTIGPSDDHYNAWTWYHAVKRAHEWVETRTGWNCNHVTSYIGSENKDGRTDSYGYLHEFIDMTSSAAGFDSLAWHEYAHALMWFMRGQNQPSGSGVQDHDFPYNTNSGNAICEGWAEFFSYMMINETTPGGSVSSNAESGGYSEFPYFMAWADNPPNNPSWDYGDWDGNEVEGAVMQMLWDIYDGRSASDRYPYSHGGDNMASGYSRILTVMLNDDPNSAAEFYTRWCNRYCGGYDDYDLLSIYDSCRITDWNGDRNDKYEADQSWTPYKSASGDPNPAWINCRFTTSRYYSSSHSVETSFTSGPDGYDTGTAVMSKEYTTTSRVAKISVRMYVSTYYHDHSWATEFLDAGIKMRLYNSAGTNYATYTYWLACWYGVNDYRTNPDPSTIKIVYNKPTLSTWLNPVVYPSQDFPSINWATCSKVKFELYLLTSGAWSDQFAAFYDDFTYNDMTPRSDGFETVDGWTGLTSGSGGYTYWLTNSYTTSRYHQGARSIQLGFDNGPVNYDSGSAVRYTEFATNYVDTVSVWMYVSTYQHDGNQYWDSMDSGIRLRLYNSAGTNYATYTYWLACWYHGNDYRTNPDPSTIKIIYNKPTLSTWLNPIQHPDRDWRIDWGQCTKVRVELYSAGSGTSNDHFMAYFDDFNIGWSGV